MGSYCNYADALAYALALQSPTEGAKYTGDPSQWHEAVYTLQDKFGDRLPQVFKHIFFDRKSGQPPFSPQVDHFLHVLAQARLMSAPNPGYIVFEMSTSQKEAITRLNGERLATHDDVLQEIGAHLADRVGAKV